MAAVQCLGYLIEVISYAPKLGVGLRQGGGFNSRAASGAWASIAQSGGTAKAGKAQTSNTGAPI